MVGRHLIKFFLVGLDLMEFGKRWSSGHPGPGAIKGPRCVDSLGQGPLKGFIMLGPQARGRLRASLC